MSWSVSYTGKAKAIVAKLKALELGGDSGIEYNAVRPYLVGIVELLEPQDAIHTLEASGHATWSGGTEGVERKIHYRGVAVTLRPFYGMILDEPETPPVQGT